MKSCNFIYLIGKSYYEVKWSRSVVTLCDPMDCSLLGSSIHGIFQARVLEWVAISFSRGSSRPRNRTQVSCIVDRRFTIWATREVSGVNTVNMVQRNITQPPNFWRTRMALGIYNIIICERGQIQTFVLKTYRHKNTAKKHPHIIMKFCCSVAKSCPTLLWPHGR